MAKLSPTKAVLPDGRLASGTLDTTIKLWDPASGEAGSCKLLFVTDAMVTALAFLPGASILVGGGCQRPAALAPARRALSQAGRSQPPPGPRRRFETPMFRFA
jgi:hypothetical protein